MSDQRPSDPCPTCGAVGTTGPCFGARTETAVRNGTTCVDCGAFFSNSSVDTKGLCGTCLEKRMTKADEEAQRVETPMAKDPYEAAHDRYYWQMGKRYPDEPGTTWDELDEDERAAWRFAFETYAELVQGRERAVPEGRVPDEDRIRAIVGSMGITEPAIGMVAILMRRVRAETEEGVSAELAALRTVAEAAGWVLRELSARNIEPVTAAGSFAIRALEDSMESYDDAVSGRRMAKAVPK